MNTVQKAVMGIIGVAMMTTLILPGRQTPKVIGAAANGFSGVLSTAMTGSTKK